MYTVYKMCGWPVEIKIFDNDTLKFTKATSTNFQLLCKRLIVQTLMYSLEFAIQINLTHGTIAIWNLAWSWSISTQISYSHLKMVNSGTLFRLIYYILAQSWSISTQTSYSCCKVANSGSPKRPNLYPISELARPS